MTHLQESGSTDVLRAIATIYFYKVPNNLFQHQRIELKPGQESVWDYPRPPRPGLSR